MDKPRQATSSPCTPRSTPLVLRPRRRSLTPLRRRNRSSEQKRRGQPGRDDLDPETTTRVSRLSAKLGHIRRRLARQEPPPRSRSPRRQLWETGQSSGDSTPREERPHREHRRGPQRPSDLLRKSKSPHTTELDIPQPKTEEYSHHYPRHYRGPLAEQPRSWKYNKPRTTPLRAAHWSLLKVSIHYHFHNGRRLHG